MVDVLASTDSPARVGVCPPGASSGLRVVLLQTQAEAAGAQEISRILGAGLSARGLDVHHVFLFRRTAAFDAQPNTHFCSRERPRGPRALMRMLADLLRHLQALQPDVVVCFQHYGNALGTIAAKLAGVRAVVINRNSARELVPAWVHALEFGFGIIGLFDRLVVNSQSVEQEYAGYPARCRDRIVRIAHGFETKTSRLSRADARAQFALPPDAVLLGSTGRLHPTKNAQAAIRLLPGRPWHLALAGQGPARGALEALATSLGVGERLHFVGELSPARIADFLAALDVFVFPSLAETFGLAAVEAAQAGVPVVANDLPVLREVLSVDERPCASLVDVADTAAFARAIELLLDEPEARLDLTTRARHLAERFGMEAMVSGYATLMRDIARPGLRRA